MEKFFDPMKTAKGDERAFVDLSEIKTLWFNTGTLCNLSCDNCYIESSPKNDRLVYLTSDDITPYLKELEYSNDKALIGLTGGEPFLNPHIITILEAILGHGHEVLVLTNAYRVLGRHHDSLLKLRGRFGDKLSLRISLDHYTQFVHEKERGPKTFDKTLEELKWLYQQGFNISLATRSLLSETQEEVIEGISDLLASLEIRLNLAEKLVIFPEMQSKKDVPEITTECWGILSKSPNDQMCASERMIVKRKGEMKTSVMPCTLLAYDDQFVLGNSLKEANKRVYLNHRFCAEFCVLGGASCSSTK